MPIIKLFKSRSFYFVLILIIIGTALTSATMFRSGSTYDFGVGFWGPNGHDAIWHLGVINQLSQHVPPENPSFSGNVLKNYHWGFDYFALLVQNLTHLSLLTVYFRLLPIIFGISIGLISYFLVRSNSKNTYFALIFIFLNYFAGSFGWLFTLLKSGTIGGESLFWSMQSASTLLNPPLAMSLIILFFGLILWNRYHHTNSLLFSILTGLVFGSLSGIKVYAGLLIGISLTLYFLYDYFIRHHSSKFNLITPVTTFLVSVIVLYFLGALSGASLLIFKPFWFVNSLIESTDKFFIPSLASLRYNLSFQLLTYKLPVYILIELFLTIIFLVGNFGTRTFGLIHLFLNIKKTKLTNFELLLSFILIVGIVIPLLFIQKGTAWNTIQFLYYSLFVANYFTARYLSTLVKLRYFYVILFLILTIPTTFSTLKDYFGFPPPSALPPDEIQALNFLKNQPTGVVLTYPYDPYVKNSFSKTPLPLYAYETTAYVAAFSSKSTFLSDQMNLDITGNDWQQRLDGSQKFFSSTDKFFSRGFLLNNNIRYIYLLNNQNFNTPVSDLYLTLIFTNPSCRLYQVQR